MYGSTAQPSRMDEFNAGLNSNSTTTATAQMFNAKTKQAITDPFMETLTPHSVLMPYVKSANGFGQSDTSRVTPGGLLPTRNGSSASTYSLTNPSLGTHLRY